MLNKHHYGKIGIFTLFVCSLWFIFFGSSIVSALPHNPVTEKVVDSKFFLVVIPQQWGFFSKNPRDVRYSVYDMDKQESAVNWPNNTPENLFGLYRLGRAQGTEMGLLHSFILEEEWKECDGDPLECLNNLTLSDKEIINSTPNGTICGEIGLVQQEPLPWAWSKNAERINMPSKVVRVNVGCSIN